MATTTPSGPSVAVVLSVTAALVGSPLSSCRIVACLLLEPPSVFLLFGSPLPSKLQVSLAFFSCTHSLLVPAPSLLHALSLELLLQVAVKGIALAIPLADAECARKVVGLAGFGRTPRMCVRWPQCFRFLS